MTIPTVKSNAQLVKFPPALNRRPLPDRVGAQPMTEEHRIALSAADEASYKVLKQQFTLFRTQLEAAEAAHERRSEAYAEELERSLFGQCPAGVPNALGRRGAGCEKMANV